MTDKSRSRESYDDDTRRRNWYPNDCNWEINNGNCENRWIASLFRKRCSESCSFFSGTSRNHNILIPSSRFKTSSVSTATSQSPFTNASRTPVNCPCSSLFFRYSTAAVPKKPRCIPVQLAAALAKFVQHPRIMFPSFGSYHLSNLLPTTTFWRWGAQPFTRDTSPNNYWLLATVEW